MRNTRLLTFSILILATLPQGAGALAGPSKDAHPYYDQIFPYWGEICGLTKIKPTEGSAGGPGGHAVKYLKGVCRDRSVSYPRLKLCEEGSIDLSDPNAGVGVSLHSMLKNVKWVAVDGRDFFLYGDLSEGNKVDRAAFDQATRRAFEERIYEGVRIAESDEAKRLEGMTYEENAAILGLGTDYAVRFGRHAYCARVPLKKEMLQPMIEYLNSVNEKYYFGTKDYKWDFLSDNCGHASHNTFAAAGFWRPKRTEKNALERALKFWYSPKNLAPPSHEFIQLARLGNDGPLDTPAQVYRNRYASSLLLNKGYLPTRAGALVDNIPIPENNDRFVPGTGFLMLNIPYIVPNRSRLKRFTTKDRYNDLETNLEHFRERYLNILARYRSADSFARRNSALDNATFREIHAKFYPYIRQQFIEVSDQLESLRKLKQAQ